jgi:hypothetical protein
MTVLECYPLKGRHSGDFSRLGPQNRVENRGDPRPSCTAGLIVLYCRILSYILLRYTERPITGRSPILWVLTWSRTEELV